MSYNDIRNWKYTNKILGEKVAALTKLSQNIDNLQPEFDELINYLNTGATAFEDNRIGKVDYENELKNINNTVSNNKELYLKIKEAAEKRISELESNISENEVKIDNESNRLKQIEREQRERERREKERKAAEIQTKKEKDDHVYIHSGPR